MNKCFSCSGGDAAQRIRENIKEFGVSVIETVHETENGFTPLSYSIGATETLSKPEVVIIGIPHKYARYFINMYFKMQKEGEDFSPGVEYDSFAEGYGTKFVEISENDYKNYLVQAYEFNITNNNKLTAFQFIYPDSSGKWPEESTDKVFLNNSILLEKK